MTDIQDFKEATEILQNVDISEMFTSLALAVAKAQSKLDENSLSQLIKYAEYKVGGKSLLELGFMPAFYALSEASISMYISLKMASKEAIEVKVNLKVEYSKENKLDSAQTNALNSNKDSKGVDDYKSGKSIVFLATEKNKVKIEDKSTVEFNPKDGERFKGAIELVEEYEDSLNKVGGNVTEVRTKITIEEQVIQSSPQITVGDTGCGYLCVSVAEVLEEKHVIFKHAVKTDDKIGDDLFVMSQEGLEKTLANIAKSAKIDGVYAFSRDGKFYEFKGEGAAQTVEKGVDMSIFFNNEVKNKKAYRLVWDKALDSKQKNDAKVIGYYIKLVNLLNTTGEPITAAGSTVSNASDTYAKNLGTRRSETLARFLKGLNMKKVETKSDNTVMQIGDTKASIILNADYIVLDKKALTAAQLTGAGENIFLAKKNKVEGTAKVIGTDITPAAPADATLTNIKTLIEGNGTLKDKYLLEMLPNGKLLYLLDKKVMLSFQLLSKESDDLKIEAEKNPASEKETITIKKDFSPSTKMQVEKPETKETGNTSTAAKDTTPSKETFGIGVSIDVRYSRQFDMSMEGNASMSAKLKSVAPPTELVTFIEKAK